MALRNRRLLAIVGIVVGIAAFRALRKRRSRTVGEESIEAAHDDLETAADHAAAAAEHGQLAAKKALKREE